MVEASYPYILKDLGFNGTYGLESLYWDPLLLSFIPFFPDLIPSGHGFNNNCHWMDFPGWISNSG
jgi:hypothetical protein